MPKTEGRRKHRCPEIVLESARSLVFIRHHQRYVRRNVDILGEFMLIFVIIHQIKQLIIEYNAFKIKYCNYFTEGRRLTSVCMSAKLSNFKNGGFGKAITISWILEIVIFNMHCASTYVRVDLSLYKHPEWRVTPIKQEYQILSQYRIEKICMIWMEYYETLWIFFFLKGLKKTYQFFVVMLES